MNVMMTSPDTSFRESGRLLFVLPPLRIPNSGGAQAGCKVKFSDSLSFNFRPGFNMECVDMPVAVQDIWVSQDCFTISTFHKHVVPSFLSCLMLVPLSSSGTPYLESARVKISSDVSNSSDITSLAPSYSRYCAFRTRTLAKIYRSGAISRAGPSGPPVHPPFCPTILRYCGILVPSSLLAFPAKIHWCHGILLFVFMRDSP